MGRVTVIVLALLVSVFCKVKYHGHSIYRVTPHDEKSLNALNSLNNDALLWKVDFLTYPRNVGDTVDISVPESEQKSLETHFKENSFTYQIHVKDLQKLIDDEEQSQDEDLSDSEDAQEMRIPTRSYLRLNRIQSYMRRLCRSGSQPCEILNIGKSYEQRDLLVFRIGRESANKPVVWIDAGIHAREWIGPATAIYMISKFMERSREMQQLLSKVTILIMPNANPDGYEYSHTHDRMWRKTRQPHKGCYGADPNRNWDNHFAGAGTSSHPCSNMYHGPYAFSEPEIKAISDFLLTQKRNLILYQSIHSYSQVWLYPWSYDRTVPRKARSLDRLGRLAARAQMLTTNLRYTVGQTSVVMYAASGSSHDWAFDKGNATYAISVELPDTGHYGFILPASYIESTGRGMVAANKAMIEEVLRLTRN